MGQTYILVFHQALWMGELMDHMLLNPNQLRYHGTQVQDNPISREPLSLMTEDKQFCVGLQILGTIVCAKTFTPSESDFESYTHIILSSPHAWDPSTVQLPKTTMSMNEFREGSFNVSSLSTYDHTQQIEMDV